MPEWWTNRSLPLSSGVMKPKPLSSLNHLTVPVAMSFLHGSVPANAEAAKATTAGAEHCVAGRGAPDLNTSTVLHRGAGAGVFGGPAGSAERVGRDSADLGHFVRGDARPLRRGEDRVGVRRLVEAVGAMAVGAQEREQP